MKYRLAVCVPTLFLSGAFAQLSNPPATASLIGEIVGSTVVDPRWQIELRPVTDFRNSPPQRVHVQGNGSFQFNQIPSGTYEVLLLDPDQREIKREVTTVGGFGTGLVQIRLKDEVKQTRGSISLKRLAHKVPKPAQKEFDRAQSDRAKRHSAEAEAHYLKALELDPQFMEAANDLGALYYVEQRFADSKQILERARTIDPDAPPVLANLSAATMALGDPVEAEGLARRAVVLDPSSIRSRYLLGLSRAWQKKYDSETQELLEQASPTIPHARLTLARLYTAKGNRDAARTELEKYLAGKPPMGAEAQRPQVEAWLKALR